MTDRELDALVAEKVMGWQRDGMWWVKEPGSRHGEPPNYSTDIADAWEVVMYLSNLQTSPKHPNDREYFYKPIVRLEFYEHDGPYECRIGRVKGFDDDTDVVGRSDERCGSERKTQSEEQTEAMCRAICLAALRVVGIEV